MLTDIFRACSAKSRVASTRELRRMSLSVAIVDCTQIRLHLEVHYAQKRGHVISPTPDLMCG
jgi:hypothetical protein